MKKLLLLAMVLFLTLCGQKQEALKIDAEKVASREVAVQVLTENEITRFIKVFPVFKTEVEKKGVKWQGFNPGEDVLSRTGSYIKASKDFAEIDAKMRAAGMSLTEFYPAMVKTVMVFSAVLWDSMMVGAKQEFEKQKQEMAKLEAKLKDPKTSEAEKTMLKMALEAAKMAGKGMDVMASVYATIPKANKDLIKKYFNELKRIFEVKE